MHYEPLSKLRRASDYLNERFYGISSRLTREREARERERERGEREREREGWKRKGERGRER